MKSAGYPFSAIVGLPEMKLALMLGAVDWRLSVLLRGDKGAGKSTAARGIADLLPADSPFVNLPLGATEDRLLGGLDLGRTMKGEPALKPGLLAQSDGGVVYIDEVNLLPDHLADSLLDVAAGGVMFLEREGFSESRECRFFLLGSMNPEEGGLRPQLLDRFALVADVHASQDPAERRCVVERRLRCEAAPQAFLQEWAPEQERLQRMLIEARQHVSSVICPADMLDLISRTVVAHNVRSLRADLAIVRASMAKAALDRRDEVAAADIEAVLPLVLAHRSKDSPKPPANPPPDREQPASTGERIFAPRQVEMPVVTSHEDKQASRGPVVSVRRNPSPVELDPRASVAMALAETGKAIPRAEDLYERVREQKSTRRFLFVVDSSGSQGVKERMSWVKGAVIGLLETSVSRCDEVAIIAFRGTTAEVVAAPTRKLEDLQRTLEYLPTGGRTPLAAGLELALEQVTPATVLILLTDGRANVPSRSEDAWADALLAAKAIRCPALVIDTEAPNGMTGRAATLAVAMNGRHVKMDELANLGPSILSLWAG